ncbi:MAG TPA: hypothetical protein VGS96_11105 [Thermoanaerobaculia bacterium]|jgi:hypothetical protein|nr:hypothetical protein [Thermoanaerobaculia bacterium]
MRVVLAALLVATPLRAGFIYDARGEANAEFCIPQFVTSVFPFHPKRRQRSIRE